MLPPTDLRWTPREIARVVFRHWRKMALFFCGVVALSLVVISVYPRSYSSEAKLFIQVGRESVALDPTATTGQTMLLHKSQADEINSALDILDSNEVERRVVELLGTDRILNEEATQGPETSSPATSGPASFIDRIGEAKASVRAWLQPMLLSLRLSDPGSDEDMATRRLDKGLQVWAPKQSTIITVTYRASSPGLAHDVVDATIKAFLEQHVRLNRVEGSLEFFAAQAETLHENLLEAQGELRDRKNEFQIISVAGERAIFEQQIQEIELQLLNTQRDLAYSEAEAADLTAAIANLEPEIVTSRVVGFANVARDGMREKLYELELQESKLRSSYQENHPLLMQVRRQREQAESILADLPDDRTQTTSALNQNQRQLELQLIQAQADVNALRARQAAAKAQLGDLHKRLLALNDRELRLTELERNVGILESKYRMHVEKLEQARVNDALGRGGITNVKVAQPATMTSKPVAPNKRVLLALGLLVATGGALGLAFFTETIDQTFRTTEQVEKELGVRVLLSIPERRRRRRPRRAGAAAAKANGRSNGEPVPHVLPSFRELVREVVSVNGNGRPHAKTVGVVGCDASKVRSRVAARLAMQAAHAGAGRVLLIDADARRRRVAKRFHLNGSPGWREVLRGDADVESCIHRPETGNLAVMAPGGTNGATHGAALAAEPAVGVLGQLEDIKTDYGLVVVDLPPGREWEGPPVTADWLDEIVLVVEAEKTRIQAARRVKDTLERAGVQVTGAVLANRREHIPGWLYRRL